MKIKIKTVRLSTGSEEGFGWMLTLHIHEKTKFFFGAFTLSSELQKRRHVVRKRDRNFFNSRLGEKYMSDKVLHHLWIENSAEYIKAVLLEKSEHPNGGIDVPRDRKAWIDKENWF